MLDTKNHVATTANTANAISRQFSPALNALLSLLIALTLVPGISNTLQAAEDTIRGSTATTMPHPELSPIGIHTGGFMLFPSLIYTGTFDDNVFATDSNKQSSYVSELSPRINANTDWNNHALNFSASSNIGKNHTFSSEDYVDWDLNADGKLNIRHDIKLFSGAGVGRDHVPRTAPNDVRGLEPTIFDKANFFTRYSQYFGRITSAINLNVIRKEYRDVPAIRLGIPVIIDNSDRDRTEYTLSLRGGYQYVGNEQVFFQLRGFQRDYDSIQKFTGFDRSSTGIEASIGTSFDYHGLLLGDFSVGYRSQNYQHPLPDINTPITKASIRWNITDLTTASFNLDRSIQETIDPFFSGFISTSTSLDLDHELKRNLLLNLSLLFIRQDYQGISPANRDDKTYNIITGSTYKVNRNLFLSVQYHYMERTGDANTSLTNSSSFNFIKNIVFFQLQTQY